MKFKQYRNIRHYIRNKILLPIANSVQLDVADMVQHSSQLRLKQHNQGNQSDLQELFHNEAEGI